MNHNLSQVSCNKSCSISIDPNIAEAYDFSGFFQNSGFSEKNFSDFLSEHSCENDADVKGWVYLDLFI